MTSLTQRILEYRKTLQRVDKLHGVVNYKLDKPNMYWILEELGITNVKIVGGNFFNTPNPFHVHTDNGKDNEPDFNVLIPLSFAEPFSTIIFDQKYSGYASHFWVGSIYKYFPDPIYNERKTDYNGVEGLTEKSFNVNDYVKYLTHLPYESLHGLSINKVHEWNDGDHYVFPCNQLHCSSNFKGIKEGLTLLCKYVD